MRVIKFRAKSLHTGEWHYGDLVQPSDNAVFIQERGTAGFFSDPNTVGQFTGLLDKNNNEIYEDDILVWGENGCKSQPLVVVFKHGSFGYTYCDDFHSFAGNTNFTFNPLNTDVRFEIVGNIHDNSELLKGGNDDNA